MPTTASRFSSSVVLVRLVLALTLVLAACSGGGEGVEGEGLDSSEEEPTGAVAESGDATSAEEPSAAGGGDGGSNTLVAALSSSPDQYDPHKTTAYPAFQVLENVYDTLVVPDPETLEMSPSLATEWTTSDDSLTWTFTLAEGVTFHDGSDFTAAAVVYSYNRIIDEELANAFRFANVDSVTAVDDATVEIVLSTPTPNLLANIGGFKGMAILPEGGGEDIDFANGGNGTGPFQIESINADGVSLTTFDDYWGEAPSIDGVDFRFIPEATTALTEVQTGNVDWTDNIPPQQVSSLEGSSDLTLSTAPSTDYWYWAVNFAREPFDDPDVRRALSLAINREAITTAARFEAATVTQTAIPPDSFWFTDYAPYSQDQEQAKQLLADAGADGLTLGLMVTDEFPETVTAAQVIASQLSEVGVTVEIEQETFATWLDRQGQGEFDAFMLGWLGNLDPFGFYHSQHVCEGSNNYQGYCDEETDQLLNDAASETDQDARKDLYDQAVQRIVDANSYMYLYNPDVVQAWKPRVSGFVTRPDKAINFETVSLG